VLFNTKKIIIIVIQRFLVTVLFLILKYEDTDHFKNIHVVLSNQPNIPVTVIPVMVKLARSAQCMLRIAMFCYHLGISMVYMF